MIEVVHKDITFCAAEELLCEKLHITKDSDVFGDVMELKNRVERIIKPAYLMKEVPVGAIEKNGAELGGQFFNSKIVSNKVHDKTSVIIFIVTCGKEIGDVLQATEDPFDNYVTDSLAYMGYLGAMDHMLKTLSVSYGVDKFISLSPGSIIDWGVAEVKKFFAITDGLYQQLGIRVLDSGLIDPLKSASGVIVRSDEEFESCDLCMRPDCVSRKSPFNQEKYDAAMNL